MRRYSTRAAVLLGLLATVAPVTMPYARAGSFPLPGSAPGSQTATADPFTGLADRPGADLLQAARGQRLRSKFLPDAGT